MAIVTSTNYSLTGEQITDLATRIKAKPDAEDVLPSSTKYGASLDLTMDSTTYVVTAQLKDQDGNNLGQAKTIDLPLESVVVSGSYDAATKKVILTLQNGSTIEFSVADLVSGLQSEITVNNKLSADLIDYTGTTAQQVTAAEKSTWNGKQDALTAGANITITGDVIAATDTTYSDFSGATASVAGAAGLVPAPAAGDNTKYLAGDGIWKTVSVYELPIATANDLGGIKVGSGLSIAGTGVLSADTQASAINASDWNALWA